MNNKGQMFAGYRLLIGAIIALLILIIIVGAINYIDRLKFDISKQRLYTGIKNGVKQPNEDVLVVEDIILAESIYSQDSLGDIGGINGECIEINAIDNEAFNLSDETIMITKDVRTSVYIQCSTNYCPDDCETCCLISFGEEID